MNTEQMLDRNELINWLVTEHNEAKLAMVKFYRESPNHDPDRWVDGHHAGRVGTYLDVLRKLGYPVDTLS